MLATPIAVVSLAPLAAFAAFGDAPNAVASLSLLNALVSGGDVLAIVLVLWQVRAGAAMRADASASSGAFRRRRVPARGPESR